MEVAEKVHSNRSLACFALSQIQPKRWAILQFKGGLTFKFLLDMLSSSTVIDLNLLTYISRTFGSLACWKWKKKNYSYKKAQETTFLRLNVHSNVLLSMNLEVQETKHEKEPRLCLNPTAWQLGIFSQKRKLSGWLIKPLTSKAHGLLLQQGSFPLIPILTVVSLSEDWLFFSLKMKSEKEQINFKRMKNKCLRKRCRGENEKWRLISNMLPVRQWITFS